MPEPTPFANQAPADSLALESRGVRWRLFFILSALAAIAITVAAFVPVKSVQERNLTVGITTLVASLVLLLWFFCWSGVAGRIRGWALGFLVLAGVFLAIFYRYDGVSGDMLPKFALRFGAVDLPELKSTEASPGSTIAIPPGASDYPQFLGPNRNLRVPALQLDTDWTKTPPKLLWKVAVGQGWGGFAVSGGYAVTQEQRESTELVVCYALATGQIVWSHADDARHDDPLGGVGPRATPTIHQGKVFSQGAQGMLNCIDLATGKLIWAKNIITEFAGKEPEYGLACSPLIYGDTVISAPGGSQGSTLVALSIADGMRVWLSGTQEASYSSPVLGMLQGREVLFYFGPVDLMACEPTSGKVFWKLPWMPEIRYPHVAVPLVTSNQHVVISSGYGKGSMKIRAELQPDGKWLAAEEWKTNRMKAKFSNLVEHQGHVYGLDDGTFACLDHEKGELKWRDGRFGHGQIIYIEPGLILVMAENGNVVLVEATPEALQEVARFVALEDKTWNPPALAGEYLVVRNDKEAACYRLPILAKPSLPQP